MISIFLSVFGICSALIQLLFFREIFPVFQGIDTIIGIIIAHIMLSFALGLYAGSFFKKSKDHKKALLVFLYILIVLFFISFIFIRDLRNILNIYPGNGISLKLSFIYIFMAVFPVTFVQGIMANIIMFFIKSKNINTPVQFSFIYQGAGIIIASILYSLYISSMTGLKTVLLIIVLLMFISAFLIENEKQKVYIIAFIAIALFFINTDWIKSADKFFLSGNFKPCIIEDYEYSAYGQNVLAHKNNEYFFFENNNLIFSNPDNDIINSEDFGHIPVLHCEKPKNILIIGGGVKYIPMLFAYNSIERIDYVEPDISTIKFIIKNIKHIADIGNNEKINIHNINTRQFIKNTDIKYDLILIGLPLPVNLYLNSFYTKEFFELANEKLQTNGFLSLKLPGRMAFSSFIMAELNQSIMDAMQEVFSYVRIIPGSQNILIASQKRMPYRLHIKKRLYEIQETTLVLSKYYLDDRMDTEKTRWLRNELAKVDKHNLLNSDKNPQGMILSMLYMQSGFSPYLSVFLDKILKYSYLAIIIIIIIFFLSKSIYKTTSFVCGASAVWLIFIALFALQTYSGQLYKLIGLGAAAFISGASLGMLYAKYIRKEIPLNKRMFDAELFFVIWILFWYILFKFSIINDIYIFAMLFGTGYVIGWEFSHLIKASKLIQENNAKKMTVYISAFIGGWFAAISGGTLLIISWGFEKSFIFILFLKFLIFCRWADIKRRGL